MYKTIFPTSTTAIYERFPVRNTSSDQIIELQPIKSGQPIGNSEYYADTTNSRLLLKFNLLSISQSVHGRQFDAYLKINASDSSQLNSEYTLYSYPLSGSYVDGNGFLNNNPEITNGVSWTYRDTINKWQTGSYNPNTTGSFNGGGNWYVNISGSQTFAYESPDVYMNITNLVKTWLSGSIPNHGLIVKFSDEDEQSANILGNLKFFSLHTHTIYIPRLDVFWNDSILTGTGSFQEIPSDDNVLYIKNLKDNYGLNEIATLRLGSRLKYPVQTYSTSSNYLVEKRLPVNSYYQIMDDSTNEIIIPFNVEGTKVNCDINGNYIKIDCSSLLNERYYKIIFKSIFDNGTIAIFDDKFNFKITKY